ncbi:hypothetical protein ACMFMF_003278 [Clarireedia jacksonii]
MEASTKAGRPWNNAVHYKRWLEEIGFVDVVERKEYAPMNPWAKEQRNKLLGIWVQKNMLMGLEALSMALFTRILGMEKHEVEQLLLEVEMDIKDTKIHCYAEGYALPHLSSLSLFCSERLLIQYVLGFWCMGENPQIELE